MKDTIIAWLNQHLNGIILAIIALLAGITIKVVWNNRSRKNTVIQKGNTVSGDLAGRDIIKNRVDNDK